MSQIVPFLHVARRRVEVRRAQVWAIRGAAVAGIATLLAQQVVRRSPGTSLLPLVLVACAAGAVVSAGGWLRCRPSLADVARLADRCLGGRERVATALALAGQEGVLVRRQRADAEAWVETADPSQVNPQSLPVRASVVGLVALVLVAFTAVLPRPGVARARADQEAQAAQAARDAAAEEIRAIADEASQAGQGEVPGRREALVSHLRRAEEALREATDNPAAVAALSRAQEDLLALGPPGGSGRRSAASAAGAALAQAAPAAAAAAALAGLDTASTDELRQLAESLSARSPEDLPGIAAQLSEAAKAAASPSAAQQLQQAADRIATGDEAAARASIEAAARIQEDHDAQTASEALEALAIAVPALSAADQADSAKALEQAAAAAAAGDPELAKSLRQAATALGEGIPGDATSALLAAGQRALSLGADARLDADVAGASNRVQSVKDALLGIQGDCASRVLAATSTSRPARGPTAGTRPTTTGAVPLAEPPTGAGTCAKLVGAGQGNGVPGEGQGESQGQGQGKGQGASQSESQGGGAGQGQGTGPGGPAPANRGGGGQEGSQGLLGRRPGLPSERIYVPGLPGTGRARDVPGGGTGIGADSQGVPYESVYSQYRDAALGQSDRQLIPEATRQLLKRYFQEDGQ